MGKLPNNPPTRCKCGGWVKVPLHRSAKPCKCKKRTQTYEEAMTKKNKKDNLKYIFWTVVSVALLWTSLIVLFG